MTRERRRIGEVEHRQLVPLRDHVEPTAFAAGLHVLLEGIEVADGRWMEHRRPELDLGKRILGVLACLPTPGEERLERLRGELDHAVALDPARPPADSGRG